SVDALLARVADRFGRIDRVVLAAGVSGDAAYRASSGLPGWRDEEHFRIKAHGVTALARAARRHDVRRVVLMSSLAGALGALSLGGYSAAAAAMDCAADHFDGDHGNWLSVGWDAWHHDSTAVSVHESRMVQDGLTAAEADAAMTDVLFSALTGHLLVVKGDLPARWDRFVRGPLRRAVAARAAAAPDSEDVPSLVLAAWRDCLADQTIGPDDDLLDRGADSLNAIDVLTALGERLGVALPTDLLFEAPTARRLAARMAEITAADQRAADRLVVHTGHAGGSPVWCLHPISGSAEGFGPLADLLAEHRVAAVAGTPLAELRADESIQSQAVRYHDALTAAVAGEPPAAIVGWSYGAVLAFEVAHLVVRATGRRPPVVLLDMPAPPGAGERGIDDVDDAEIVLAILSHRVRENGQRPDSALAGLPRSADALPRLVRLLRDRGVVPRGFTADTAADLAAGYRRRMRAVERHRPRPYPGPVVLLRASEAEFGATGLLEGVLTAPVDDPGWGWAAVAAGGFTTQILDGHHATLLAPPAVAAVAAAVRRAVSASQEA
ncbi:thioesterase domain-containing protein, partial [Streptomyces sp.]|uniref:thioesterase domain-containing protein n=1 Tax=Streptomyces sp. TaxID=1931 RepID=UPI002F3F75D4